MTPVEGQQYIVGDTLWGLFAERCRLSPEHLMLCDEHDREVSYAQAMAWVERVAAGLQGLGIGVDTPVSWQLPTRIETVVFSLALSRLGAVQNPIIHLYRAHEVGSLLETTQARFFAVVSEWKGFNFEAMARDLMAERALPCDVLVLDDGLPEGDPAGLPPEPSSGDTVRWIYATSGTTSVPKAVLHTDRSLIAGGEGLGRAYAPLDTDIGTLYYPYAHIGGPDLLVIALEYRLSLVLAESFVPADAVRQMQRRKVTFSGGSTAFYQAFVAEQLKNPGVKLLPDLRYLSGGGAPKPPEVYWQVREVLDVPVYHGFGSTECPSMASCGSADTDEQRAYTDGLPVPGAEFQIRDEQQVVLPAGQEGEIWVRGPMVCQGYTDPEATADAFDDEGYFDTGDRGLIRSDGRVVITGRSKDMIIRKGENVSPREIEDAIITHPNVASVAVIGVPDVERGEMVCAVIELVPGAAPITMVEVQQRCAEAGLMKQKYPERLEFIDVLPRNPTMKILKTELRKMFGS